MDGEKQIGPVKEFRGTMKQEEKRDTRSKAPIPHRLS